MQKRLLVLMLLGMAASAFAVTAVLPQGQQDVVPGLDTLDYDDGAYYQKIGYPAIGTGWGVRFTQFDPGDWLKVTEVQVNLCPPPLDGPYREEVRIYEDDGPGNTPGTLLYAEEYDVRVGQWWHYIEPDTALWVEGSFFVFSIVKTYHTSIFQWF
ncbi:hypothetical protein FJY71_06290, partial [candidate division WOR-3 bacterium]|nr:hypothetical protein [candidate division WOR-3 bacterium]